MQCEGSDLEINVDELNYLVAHGHWSVTGRSSRLYDDLDFAGRNLHPSRRENPPQRTLLTAEIAVLPHVLSQVECGGSTMHTEGQQQGQQLISVLET